MRRSSGLVLIALVGALVCSAPAAAQTAVISGETFDRRGLPLLVANPLPDGREGKIVAWRKCQPSAPCEALPLDGDDDRGIEPGEVPVGTIFEADARANTGAVTTARSLPWRGRVESTGTPSLAGPLRAGRLMRPLGAIWRGGWDGDYSLLGIEACRTPTGRQCETVSPARRRAPTECSAGRVVISSRYVGWWLRAVDARVAADTAFPALGYQRVRDVPMPLPGPTVARSALVGPVRGAVGNYRECAKPTLLILPRAVPNRGRLVVARVKCESSCQVALTIRDRKRTIRRVTEANGIGFGFADLSVTTRPVGARANVRVIVNGRHRAQAVVRLPPRRRR